MRITTLSTPEPPQTDQIVAMMHGRDFDLTTARQQFWQLVNWLDQAHKAMAAADLQDGFAKLHARADGWQTMN